MAHEFDYTEANGERHLFLGDDKQIDLYVYNGDGLTSEELAAAIAANTATMKDISGWALRFAVKRSDKASDPAIINKTTTSGIVISGTFNASQGLNTQKATVTFLDTDSDPSVTTLTARKYRYAFKRTDDGSETTLSYGDFQFKSATTRA